MEPRKTAYEILYRVFYEHGFASLLMREIKMDQPSMAFVSQLVYGTIRNRSLLEYQWKDLVRKTRSRAEVLLDMACYELYFMSSPSYAVLNEVVSLAPKKDRAFINAVLRQVSSRQLQQPHDPSISCSMPEWIIRLWNAHYGECRCNQLLQIFQTPAGVYGRWNPIKAEKQQLSELDHYTWLDEWSFSSDIPIQKTRDFLNGRVVIQNPSSLLPVMMMDVKPGMKVLDTCASPGTKTQMMAVLMENTGSITACDLYEHRLSLIDHLMEKTGVKIVETMVADGTKLAQEHVESFDRVLCDVPCSGLGDLRHKPEIRWHLTPDDMDEIILIQQQILQTSSCYVRNGGKLVYSTCTLNNRENGKQIRDFLKNHPEFELMEEKTVFPDEIHDGFYAACMVKKERDMIE